MVLGIHYKAFFCFLLVIDLFAYGMQKREQSEEHKNSKVPTLKALIAQSLSKIAFQDHPYKNIENIRSIVSATEPIKSFLTSQENKDIVRRNAAQLALLNKPYPISRFSFSTHFITNAQFTADSNQLITNSFNQHKRVFDIPKQKNHLLDRCRQFNGTYQTSVDGKYLFDSHDGYACLWQLETYQCKDQIESPAVSLCPQSKYIAVQKDNNLVVSTLENNEPVCSLPAWVINSSCLQFSSDSTLLVAKGDRDKKNINIFRIPQGKWCSELSGRLVTFNHDGTLLAVIATEEQHAVRTVLQIYETNNFVQRSNSEHTCTGEPIAVTFSINGKRIATQFQNGWYEVFDVEKKEWCK